MTVCTEVPKVLGNIPSLVGPDPAELKFFLDSSTPVIVRNAMADCSIGAIDTEAAAVAALGDITIQIQQNYTSPLTRGGGRHDGHSVLSQKVRNEIREMRLADYCAHVHADPDTDLLCVEYHTPAPVLDLMRIPECCSPSDSLEPLVSFLFLANRGNYAHLHFDGDYRNVLLYQVFGRKRVVMVPLTATEKIAPAMNFSKLLIQNMSESEKLDLFRYLGAYDCLIAPGDMVYFPPSIWHYVEYVDNGMSVNFRFGRDDIARRLVDANRVPFYPQLHQLLDGLGRLGDAERRRLADTMWTRLAATLGRDYPSARDRHRSVQDLYRDLLHELPGRELPRQLSTDCPIADAMAIERYESQSRLWREELMLGVPL